MVFEKEQILKLLELSDEELLPRLNVVLEALGVPPQSRETLLSDAGELRKKAQNISEFDLYKARLLLGEEQLKNLLAILGQ